MKGPYLNHVQFFEHPHVTRKYKCRPHTNKSQILIIIEEDRLHVREKRSVQE